MRRRRATSLGRGCPAPAERGGGRRCEPGQAAAVADGYIKGRRADGGPSPPGPGPLRARERGAAAAGSRPVRAASGWEGPGGRGGEGRVREAGTAGARRAEDGGAGLAKSRQGRRRATAPPLRPSLGAAGDGGLPLGICLYVLSKQLERPGGGALAGEWRPMLSNGGGERGPCVQWAQGGVAAGPQYVRLCRGWGGRGGHIRWEGTGMGGLSASGAETGLRAGCRAGGGPGVGPGVGWSPSGPGNRPEEPDLPRLLPSGGGREVPRAV